MSGFGNLQILAATSEDTCEYYERGLLAPAWTMRPRRPTWKRSATRSMRTAVWPSAGARLGYKIRRSISRRIGREIPSLSPP